MAVWTVYLSLCLLMALTASVEANPVRSKDCGVCPTAWYAFECRCFAYFSHLYTWIDAEAVCLYYGGNLASVHSHRDYMFIQNLIRSITHTSTRAWIGGHDAVHEGHWLWSDGSKMKYQIWAPGQPDNANGKEHCLEINYDNGNWNDYPCFQKNPFVCVKRTGM